MENLSPANNYRGRSLQKIAVLFTDIIGSTQFFQSHGNLSGRAMLQQHERIVSNIVKPFGGMVVKNIGDSILAYFADCQEAIKSAVQIQETLRRYNRRSGADRNILVRIGIHFDEGVVEDNDIFGDAVNIASKITNLADGNQIFISQNVLDRVNSNPSLRFEAVEDLRTPANLILYKVLWERSVGFAPDAVPVLYMRPFIKEERESFNLLWEHIINTKSIFWENIVDAEAVMDDKTIILSAKRLSSLMEVAVDVFRFIRVRMGALSAVTVQMIVDAGPHQSIDQLAGKGFKGEWKGFRQGTIFLSPKAYDLIEEEGLSVTKVSLPGIELPQPFYEIAPDDYKDKEDEILFTFQDELSRGEHPQCFYCGSRKHNICECPSKNLTTVTAVLNSLGYLPINQINEMFRLYLANPECDKGADGMGHKEGDSLHDISANSSFYELKQIFQLRFFREIWDTNSGGNVQIEEEMEPADGTGRLIWLAQDCIRVSNHARAESILQSCLEKYPDDYRTYCTLGLLNMEQDNYSRIEQYLDKALYQANTNYQKTFILFLLFRFYDLAEFQDKALKRIREIKLISPYHSEAIYQESLMIFKQGATDVALKKLVSLVLMNREYYIKALIDPALAPFSSLVHPALKKIFTGTRQEAQVKVHDATLEFLSMEQFFAEEDEEMESARSILSKIHNLTSQNSYYGYLDIVDLSNSLISACRNAKSRQKRHLLERVKNVEKKIASILLFFEKNRRQLASSYVYQRLKTIQSEFMEIAESATFNNFKKFKDMSMGLQKISKELRRIELEMQRVKRALDIKTFSLMFVKQSFFTLCVILVVGTIILPTIFYYINTFLPEVSVIAGRNIRLYHQYLIIFGVVAGLAFSFFKSFKTFLRGKS